MWTPATRRQQSRAKLRHESELTDAEWTILAPFLPALARCGRRRAYAMREIVNAISYTTESGGCGATMPARRLKDVSVMRWSTRMAGYSSCRPTRPRSKTVTGSGRCCGPLAQAGRSCSWPMRIQATRVHAWPRPAPCGSRLSTRPKAKSDSPCMHGAGSSSAYSPGSTATAAWPKM